MPAQIGSLITSALSISEIGATTIVGTLTVNTLIGNVVVVAAELDIARPKDQISVSQLCSTNS